MKVKHDNCILAWQMCWLYEFAIVSSCCGIEFISDKSKFPWR